MTKKTLTAKLSPKNLNRLENYADREGISKSEATDRLVKQGLDVEESDMRLVPVQTDGGTIIEDRLDEIERNQQNRLKEIDQKVELLDDDPSRTKEALDQAVLWSFGFTMAGGIIGLLVSLGVLSIGTNVIVPFTMVSGLIFGVSNLIRDTVYGEESPL
jgi:hypothetical protein